MAKLVKLTGFRDLEKALASLPQATAKAVLRKVAKRALEPMRAAAAAAAPVSEQPYTRGSFARGTLRTVLPGRLKRSIVVSTKRTRRVRKARGPINGLEMAMGPSGGTGALSYATFTEFGTDDTPPQPFMRPAWDGHADGALDIIRADLGREIDAASKRAAKRAARKARP